MEGDRRGRSARADGGAGDGAEDRALTSTRRSRPIRSRRTKTAFKAANPNIDVKWVRDSTGVITAKLLAEKANPQADLVVGTSASSLAVLSNEGMLQPYAPKGLDKISAAIPRSAQSARMGRHGRLRRGDLLQHRRGREAQTCRSRATVEGPDQAGLQGQDRDAEPGVVRHRLPRRRRLDPDVGRRRKRGSTWMRCTTTSRSTRTRAASRVARPAPGEFPIGVSFEYRAVATKKSGAPIDIIFPTEGLGWDLEASGIMKNTKKVEAARVMMDWLATPGAMELFAKNFAVLAMPGMAKPLDYVPADYEQRLIKNDFAWSAKNREKILAEMD